VFFVRAHHHHAPPPRRRRHQTLHISTEITLCDCPGLVFPSFTSSRAEMVISGVVPIAQLRDFISPVQLICHVRSQSHALFYF
jgi:large subunit GTPase 1